jgi:hypothetical protein
MQTATRYTERYYPGGGILWDVWAADQERRMRGGAPVLAIDPGSLPEAYQLLLAQPEPSYQEVATAGFLADAFLGLGYSLEERSGSAPFETQLILVPRKPCATFLRCDLDAVSIGAGAHAHNCGHAVNMTSMLGLARMLRHEGIEDVGFIFQPAEEGPGIAAEGFLHPQGFGGGQFLRAKGVYAAVPRLLSCHIDTSLRPGQVRITAGQATAAAYRFSLAAQGVPAHAALPWQGKNPVEEAAAFLDGLRALNQRFKQLAEGDPSLYGLVTATQVATAPCEINSLAPLCTVAGISRISGEPMLDVFRQMMAAHGCGVEIEAPPVMNDPALAETAVGAALALGLEVVTPPARFRDETAWAGSFTLPWADPALYPEGCAHVLHFFISGGENPGGLHTIGFDPDPASIDVQVGMLLEIIRRLT